MEQRLINANELEANMYHEAFETDTDMQKWDSGCWIRYKMFENQIEKMPTVDAVPRSLYEQTQWERDIALSQLKQLNIELGEKPYHKAIPIEWIVGWLTKQHIPATHTCDDYYAVEMMLEDWEKEDGLNK